MPNDPAPPPAPYGIDPLRHGVPRLARWRTPMAVAVFVVVLGSALLGWLGGAGPRVVEHRAPTLTARLEYEPILRSGNWFETVLTISPARDVSDLVVAVDQPLWRGMSIDTLAPDAESSNGLDGRYAYHFGTVRKGERFRVKFDGQIQPRALRTLSGSIHIDDGERALTAIAMQVTVLP